MSVRVRLRTGETITFDGPARVKHEVRSLESGEVEHWTVINGEHGGVLGRYRSEQVRSYSLYPEDPTDAAARDEPSAHETEKEAGRVLREAFLAEYERNRTRLEQMLEGLDDVDLRRSPLAQSAAPAWYWWNRVRVEDFGFARLGGGTQVIDLPGWLGRLNVTTAEAGQPVQAYVLQAPVTEDTGGLSQRLNLVGLRAYWVEVGVRVRQIIARLPEDDFDSPIGGSYVPEARGSTEAAVWTAVYRSGRTARGRVRTPEEDVLRSRTIWSSSIQLIRVAHAIKRGRR